MKRPKPAGLPRSPRVAIAYLHPGEVSASFQFSLTRMMMYETARGNPPYLLAQRVGSGRLVEGRNEAVEQFLAVPNCEWLLFVDSDMGFGADALQLLLDVADTHSHPIVGGLCFGMRVSRSGHDDYTQAEYLEMFPTIYAYHERVDDQGEIIEVGFAATDSYPRGELVECSATGAAFFLTHRSVLERIRARYGDHWFSQITHPQPAPKGTTFSEDLSFFVRAAAVDAPCHVHTGVVTSHDKGGVFLTEHTYLRQVAADLLVDRDGQPRIDFALVVDLVNTNSAAA